MTQTCIATGKTIDQAVESALAQLGLERDRVSVQVLQQAKSGFLGFGAKPAKVCITYEAAVEEPVVPKPSAVQTPDAPEASTTQTSDEPELVSVNPDSAESPAVPGIVDAAAIEQEITRFFQELLQHMGVEAQLQMPHRTGNTYHVDLVGENLEFLIGYRGATLDAMQTLCQSIVNRKIEGHVRINVDVAGYRKKRNGELRRYARQKAQQVLRNRRRIVLEPMTAYERRVVHAALQHMDGITTHSIGTEPNRRIVIEYV